jgi:hypothetical protein
MMTDVQRKSYPGILFTDSGFQREHTDELLLRLFISEAQLIFCVLDDRNNRLLHMQSYNFFQFASPAEYYATINNLFQQEELLNKTYRAIGVFIFNAYNTLVPGELFDEALLSSYIRFNFDTTITFNYASDQLINNDIINVYGIPDELKHSILHQFRDASVKHNSTVLIDHLQSLPSNEERIYIYVQSNILQVCFIQNQRVMFFNSFPYATPEDFIYYLLYTYQQLKLDTENTPVYLMGEIVKESSLYEMLYKYIRHIHFMKRPDRIQVPESLNMPAHFYYNLFC